MRLSYKPIIGIIFFIAFFSYGAIADDGTSVVPESSSGGNQWTSGHSIDMEPIPGYPEATTGIDWAFSFWELPAYVQITYVALAVGGILGLMKLMPFVSGRLKHALENPKTKEIFYYIQSNPGLTIQQLSDEQHMNRGTLKYHLGQLFSNNKITLIRRGKVSQLYHNTIAPRDTESIIASYLRREDKSRSILFSIMDNPGLTNKDLSEKFALDKSTITDYMKKFTDDGIVELRQDGKFKRCYVQQDARMILLRFRPQ